MRTKVFLDNNGLIWYHKAVKRGLKKFFSPANYSSGSRGPEDDETEAYDMKKAVGVFLAFLTVIAVLFSFSAPILAAGYYVHDPMENPRAAADIVVDPDAVYGYAPNPDSSRLGVYAQYDWSDEAFVAEMRQEREDYHASVKELYQIKADMEAEGKSVEEIARAVSTRRNEIRMEAYQDDPEGLEKLKESNLASFGNENGGTPDYFYEKYGSWETVIEKAFSTNAGADAILGLYDKYYDTYMIDGDQSEPTAAAEPTQTEETETDETQPADQTEPTDNATVKSPKTGDPLPGLAVLMLTAAGAAGLSTAVLRKSKDQTR